MSINNKHSQFTSVKRDKNLNSLQTTTRDKIPRFRNIDAVGGLGGEPGQEGEIILNRSDNTFYGHDGFSWVPLNNIPVSLRGVGGHRHYATNLVVDGCGPDLLIRNLCAGKGIYLDTCNGCVTITNTATSGDDVTLTSIGNEGQDLVPGGVSQGPTLEIRKVKAGKGLSATIEDGSLVLTNENPTPTELISALCPGGTDLVVEGTSNPLVISQLKGVNGAVVSKKADCVEISTEITLDNACTDPEGISLVANKSGPNLAVKGLLEGQGIELTKTDGCVTITNTNPTPAPITTLSDVGGGNKSAGLVVGDGIGPDLEIGRLNPGTGIDVQKEGDGSVTITNTEPASSITISNVPCCSPDVALELVSGQAPNFEILTFKRFGKGISLDVDDCCVTLTNTEPNVPTHLISPGCSPEDSASLVIDGDSNPLVIRNLSAVGKGIKVEEVGNCVEISNTNTLKGKGGCHHAVDLVLKGDAPEFEIRNLNAGRGIELDTYDGCVTITNTKDCDQVTLCGKGCCPCDSVNLVLDGCGPNLAIRNLTAGEGIDLDTDCDGCLVISSNCPPTTLTGLACSPEESPAGSVDLVVDGTGPNLVIRNLNAGKGITLDTDAGCVTINTDITLSSVDCSPVDPEAKDLVLNSTGPDLLLRKVTAGDGIELSTETGCLEISAIPEPPVTLNSQDCSPEDSPDTSVDLVLEGTGPNLVIRKLEAGEGITFDTENSCVRINATPEPPVTLSSLECSPMFSPANEVDLVVDGTGPDLVIRRLNGGKGIILDIDNGCVNINSFDGLVSLNSAECSPANPEAVDLVLDGVGPEFVIRQLVAGDGIELNTDSVCVEINAEPVTLSSQDCSPGDSPDTSVDLVLEGTGPDLVIRKLEAGEGITFDTENSCVRINATPEPTVTLTSLECSPMFSPANEVDLVVDGTGPELVIRRLNGGKGIILDTDNGCVNINSFDGLVSLNSAECSPANPEAVDLVLDGVGPEFVIRQLVAGDGIELNTDSLCVEISAEPVTLSSADCSPGDSPDTSVDLVIDGDGPDLVIRKLKAGRNVNLNDSSNCIEITADDDGVFATDMNGNVITDNAAAGITAGGLSVVGGNQASAANNSVALGSFATSNKNNATTLVGANTFALGLDSEGATTVGFNSSAGKNSAALGSFANAGDGSVALGNQANASEFNSIVINATGAALMSTAEDAFFVKPIRDADLVSPAPDQMLCYDPASGEITYTDKLVPDVTTLSSLACSPAFSPANEVDLVVDGDGPELVIRKLNGGKGIILDTDNGCVNINSFDAMISLGSTKCSPEGVDIVADGVGPELKVKQFIGGGGIDVTADDTCVTVTNTTSLNSAECSPANKDAVDLVLEGDGPDFVIRQLLAGDGIELNTDGVCVEVINTDPGSAVTLTSQDCSPAFSPANEVDLVVDGDGPDLVIRKLNGGKGIILDTDNGCVNINSFDAMISLGSTKCSPEGVDIVADGVGPELKVKQFIGGAGIDVTADDTCVTVTNTTSLNSAECSPANKDAVDLVLEGDGPDFVIRQLLAGDGIELNTDGVCVEVINTDPGSAVTLTSQACSPADSPDTSVDLVLDGVGPDLVIRKLKAGRNVNLDDSSSCVEITADDDGVFATDTNGNVITDNAAAGITAGGLSVVGGNKASAANNSVALGSFSTSNKNNATTLVGANTFAFGFASEGATTVGFNSSAGKNSAALGSFANAGDGSVALGNKANASEFNSIVINATGGTLSSLADEAFYVKPVRPADQASPAPDQMLCYDPASGEVTYADKPDMTTLSSLACSPELSPSNEIDLVVEGDGPELVIRKLNGGKGIILDTDNGCVNINSFDAMISLVSTECSPEGANIVADGSGPELKVKQFIGGAGIDVTADDTCVTVTNIAPQVTLISQACSPESSPDTSVDLVVDGDGPELVIRKLKGGVELSDDGCVNITGIAKDDGVFATDAAGNVITDNAAAGITAGDLAVAGGFGATADASAIALGSGSNAAADSIAMGASANASGGMGALAIGEVSIASAAFTTALGSQSKATGSNSTAIGSGAVANNNSTLVLNAGGTLTSALDSAFYVNPIRDASGDSPQPELMLCYDNTTKEVTYLPKEEAPQVTLSSQDCSPESSPDTSVDLVVDGDGPELVIRKLKGGVELSDDGCIDITGKDDGFIATDLAGVPITDNSVSGPTMNGKGSIVAGINAFCKRDNCIIIGQGAGNATLNADSIAIGKSANSCGGSVALGNNATAIAGSNSVAIGDQSTTEEQNSVAIGFQSTAGNTAGVTSKGIAIGSESKATGQNSVALGANAVVQENNSIVITANGALTSAQNKALYIDPIRDASGDSPQPELMLCYDTASKEVTYLPKEDPVNVTLTSQDCSPEGSPDDSVDLVVEGNGPELVIRKLKGGVALSDDGCIDITDDGFQATDAAGNLITDNAAAGILTSNVNNVAGGAGAQATGQNSIAFGLNAVGGGFSNSVAIGNTAVADGGGVAVGSDAQTNNGINSVAVGAGAKTFAAEAVALGLNSEASGPGSSALGTNSEAQGINSVAIAPGSVAKGGSSIAIGVNATTELDTSIAIGFGTSAIGQDSITIGASSSADNGRSIALGVESSAGEERSIAIGTESSATDNRTIAIGDLAVAGGGNESPPFDAPRAVAIGPGAKAFAGRSLAIGDSAETLNFNSLAIGLAAKVDVGGEAGIAIGLAAQSKSLDSISIGRDAGLANSGINSVVIGQNSSGVADAVAVGALATVGGQYGIAVGLNSKAGLADAISIGRDAGQNKSGFRSVALGLDTNAGNDSIAIGVKAQATNNSSIVINATGAVLQSVDDDAFYVDPIRPADQASPVPDQMLCYDTTTKEITYASKPTIEVFEAYSNDNQGLLVGATTVNMIQRADLPVSSTYSWNNVTDTLTFNEAGIYQVVYHITLEGDGGGGGGNDGATAVVRYNNGGGASNYPGSLSAVIVSDSDRQTSGATVLINATASSTVSIQVTSNTPGANLDLQQNGCNLAVIKLA